MKIKGKIKNKEIKRENKGKENLYKRKSLEEIEGRNFLDVGRQNVGRIGIDVR